MQLDSTAAMSQSVWAGGVVRAPQAGSGRSVAGPVGGPH